MPCIEIERRTESIADKEKTPRLILIVRRENCRSIWVQLAWIQEDQRQCDENVWIASLKNKLASKFHFGLVHKSSSYREPMKRPESKTKSRDQRAEPAGKFAQLRREKT